MRPFKIRFTAVLVAAFFVFGPACAASSFSASVRQCVDGDTLVLDNGRRVRLAGVDTPEKGDAETPPQYYASEAQRFTEALAQGKRVRIHPLAGSSQDRYRRLLAEIILPDGRSLNEEILRHGRGYLFIHRNLPQGLVKRLRKAQNAALDRRAGCWKALLASPRARQAYVGNRASARFFSETCLRTAAVARRNQRPFPDLEAAFRAGYAPARPCGIWPSAGGGVK